jgi:hypothetical protein
MPLGLGHWWVFLLILIFYGAIAVGVVLLIRAIFFRTPSNASAQVTALEGIRRTLEDLKQAVERLEKKVEDRSRPTASSEDR